MRDLFSELTWNHVHKAKEGPDRVSAKTAEQELLIIRLLLIIPVLNWFVKDAMYGEDDAKYWFIGNLAMVWAVCIFLFGYPAIILPALAMVPMAFLWILDVCR